MAFSDTAPTRPPSLPHLPPRPLPFQPPLLTHLGKKAFPVAFNYPINQSLAILLKSFKEFYSGEQPKAFARHGGPGNVKSQRNSNSMG